MRGSALALERPTIRIAMAAARIWNGFRPAALGWCLWFMSDSSFQRVATGGRYGLAIQSIGTEPSEPTAPFAGSTSTTNPVAVFRAKLTTQREGGLTAGVK